MDNKIAALPKGFYKLTLKELNLSQNFFYEIPLPDINALLLETLIIEKNPFYRLPHDLLKFQGLSCFKIGWLQYCSPSQSEPLAFSRPSPCSDLTIMKLFDDFSIKGMPPSWITCFQILTRYSDDQSWTIHGRSSLNFRSESGSKVSYVQ
jgi:hypothetical protein